MIRSHRFSKAFLLLWRVRPGGSVRQQVQAGRLAPFDRPLEVQGPVQCLHFLTRMITGLLVLARLPGLRFEKGYQDKASEGEEVHIQPQLEYGHGTGILYRSMLA